MLDPFILSKELRRRSCSILNVSRYSDSNWGYVIDTNTSTINDSINARMNIRMRLTKPLSAYFIKIKDSSLMKVSSKRLNYWFPYIVFYDNELNVLKVVKEKNVKKSYEVVVPESTVYVKLSDLYTLKNIKSGLNVLFSD